MSNALYFLIPTVPLMLYAALSDLRTMTIPNWVSIALLAGFVVVGLIVLPLETLGWCLVVAVIALVVGILVHGLGLMGGGDVKLLAAFAPYVSGADAHVFLMILSASMLVTLVLHRIARSIGAIRRLAPDWKSWSAGQFFPMGISIALAAISYLAVRASTGA